MNFRQDAPVRMANGDEVGRVDRVVIDPKTNEVTYIVVRKGALFTEDKVVPIGMIAAASDEGVQLRPDAGDLQDLPQYQETYYVPADEADSAPGQTSYAPPVYAYAPYGSPSMGLAFGAALMQPDVVAKTTTNIPENEIALKQGAKVMSRDDKHVGDVEQVLTDPNTNRASHFVISQGLLFKSRKLVPMDWVANVSEEEVRLAVNSKTLERTSDYNEGRSAPII